jgi:hypothetical protein
MVVGVPRGQQDDPCSPDVLLRGVPVADHGRKLGNLFDNASKWARQRVIAGHRGGPIVEMTIEVGSTKR